MLVRVVISVALAGVILYVTLFFWLKENYVQYNSDGTIKLDMPFLSDSDAVED